MVQKGTYAELLKSGVDFASLLKKENEEAEPSPGSGIPTLISESSVQSQLSPRHSLKDAAPEDQDVSFSSCNMLWFVCSWWPHGPSVCFSNDIFIFPKVDPKVPKVLFHEIHGKA